MRRRHILSALVILLALALAPPPVAAQNKRNFDKLADEILQTIQSFYPVRSTEAGIHAYDNRLTDYSDKSVKNMIKKLNSLQKKIYHYRNANLNTDDRLDYHLLKSDLDMALLDLKQIEWQKRSPLLYVDEAVEGLHSLMVSPHASLDQKLFPIMERVKAVPDLMKTARRNITKPPALYIQAATEALESGTAFYREVGAELMKQYPDRADEILRQFTAAREALNDFSIYLAGLTPGDESRIAIGKKNFDYILSNGDFLDYDSDSLLALGESLLAKAQKEYHNYETEVEDDHQNASEPVFVPASFNRQDILDYYSWEVDQVREFLEANNIVTVPENIAPIAVVETPDYLRTMIAGIAYQPAGAFDSVQQAYFYVRPIPKDLDQKQLEARFRYIQRRGFRGSVVHEAYPGHHLQYQIASRLSDPVRKWHQNMMFVEGWALYCEEMMYNQGLYGDEDPAMWLAVLDGIRFRAARIVADVKISTGQFTYDQCVKWMCDQLDAETSSEQEYLAKEVRKIAHYPGVRMSYLTGKLEIERLRSAAEEKWGDEFTLRKFHDKLLSYGAVPPTLLWDAMDLADYRGQVALEQ